jgi:hypothetical protein
VITPFACLHLRSRTDELPEYFVPQPSRDSLLFEPAPPPLPPPTINRSVVDACLISPRRINHNENGVLPLIGVSIETLVVLSFLVTEEWKPSKPVKDVPPPSRYEDLIWDEALYYTNQKRWAPKYRGKRCYIPQIHEIELTDVCLVDTERTPCDVVPFGYCNGKGELLSTPKPQPVPAPLLNAEHYSAFGIIPNLRLKSTAKTNAGVVRFREKATKLWDNNKVIHRLWNSVLGKCCVSCGDYRTDKVDGVTVCANCKTEWRSMRDERTFCYRCGSSFFRFRKKGLACHDCGWLQGDSTSWWNAKNVGSTDRETTQGTANRREWLASRIRFFNPLGRKLNELIAEEIAQIKNSPEFAQASQEYVVEFSNTKTKDAAQELGIKPNTLTKRISRQKLEGGLKSVYHDVDFTEAVGNYFCVVSLNGRNQLKILGTKDALFGDVLKAFFVEWRKSEANGVKQARKTAKKDGLSKKAAKTLEIETVTRTQAGYETVVVGLFVPDADGRGGTYSHFLIYELVELAAQESSTASALKLLGGEPVLA